MLATMKKKHADDKPRTNDRRVTPTFMVRMRELYREPLKRLAEQNRRNMVSELEIALEAHLTAAGLWPPTEGDAQ